MKEQNDIYTFLSGYGEAIQIRALELGKVITSTLPGITVQLDLPAKMIAYCYGQKYSELICMVIPSKKGLKLGFNRGTQLPDPDNILEGTGKISRYVIINAIDEVHTPGIKNLLLAALKLYKELH